MLGKTHHYFERAERAYDRAVRLIRGLDEAFQGAAFRDDPEQRYDTRVTLYQFDVILQAILLKMALTDGDFHRLERRLIDRITDYGDLTVYLRKDSGGTLDLTWERIGELDGETQRSLLERLPAVLERTCDSFVLPLALADGAVDSIDFLARLEGELEKIALSLSGVDGRDEAAERAAYADMLEHLLTRRWRRIKAQAQGAD